MHRPPARRSGLAREKRGKEVDLPLGLSGVSAGSAGVPPAPRTKSAWVLGLPCGLLKARDGSQLTGPSIWRSRGNGVPDRGRDGTRLAPKISPLDVPGGRPGPRQRVRGLRTGSWKGGNTMNPIELLLLIIDLLSEPAILAGPEGDPDG